MNRRTGWGVWLVGVLVGIQAWLSGGAVWGEERFRAGTKDFTLAGGYSVSHNNSVSRGLDTVEGFHAIPHFGYFLTDERGSGWLRGNFELLAEPTLLHLREEKESATLVGLAALGRWVFAAGGSVRPYIEGGVGVLGGQANFRQTNCDVNFSLQGGIGVLVFVSQTTAVTAGYRFHHLSNNDLCSNNLGLNSSLFILGFSFFFP